MTHGCLDIFAPLSSPTKTGASLGSLVWLGLDSAPMAGLRLRAELEVLRPSLGHLGSLVAPSRGDHGTGAPAWFGEAVWIALVRCWFRVLGPEGRVKAWSGGSGSSSP